MVVSDIRGRRTYIIMRPHRILMVLSLAAFALLVVPSMAEASGWSWRRGNDRHERDRDRRDDGRRWNKDRRKSVPEFDPSAAGAVVTLLAGGTLLARRRDAR